jgi:DNA-binding response OmpR family regulator
MIIDENAGIRELYALELAGRGYEVTTTGDASAVEEMIAALEPDLVLVDPYIGGEYRWDVVGGIKERNAHLCVLLCTLFVIDDNDPHFHLADGFVVKSSCTDELILKVETLLTRKGRGKRKTLKGRERSGEDNDGKED